MKSGMPNWSLFGSIVPVHNAVAIGAIDTRIIDRIEQAILRHDQKLRIIRFTPRETANTVLGSQSSGSKEKGMVPLVIIFADAPARSADPKAAKSAVARLLRIAQGLAKKPRLVVIGISEDISRRAMLIEAGCAAALTLNEAIAAIPVQLDAWLIYRQ